LSDYNVKIFFDRGFEGKEKLDVSNGQPKKSRFAKDY